MKTEKFSPSEIAITPRFRGVDASKVQQIAESISGIGLQTPITVRWNTDADGDQIVLVAGAHRLAACKLLDFPLIECVVFEGSEHDARLWEIAENLHRAELTVQERAEHISEWIKLVNEQSAQVAPKGPTGHRPQSGINAATRELGIDRTEAQRAVKIAGIAPEAKVAAVDAGINDNQSALLRVAKERSPADQLAAIEREKSLADSKKANRVTDQIIVERRIEAIKEWLAARLDVTELHDLGEMLAGIADPISRALMREAA